MFGLFFLVPLFGMAVGAAVGALARSLTQVGINQDFIRKTRDSVTESTSALFLLTSDAVEDRVADALKGIDFELVSKSLSREEEAKLREAFSEEEYLRVP